MKPAVARAAVAAGASIWNDVTALTYEAHSPSTAADLGCDVVLMHMRGDPRSMAGLAHYGDVVADVCAELRLRAKNAVAAGVDPKMIWLDPGLGFAKTAEQSLALLQNLKILVDLGHRVLVGASRKSFLRTLDPAAVDPADRLAASLAAARLAAGSGATAVRVHDVWETVQALT